MNLPHQKPLIFAQKVLEKEIDTATVLCEFNEIPTLPMFIEAAAQSSAAFAPDNSTLMGFLTLCKNVKLLLPLKEKHYHIKITHEIEINSVKRFFFEAYDLRDEVKYVSGNLTIVTEG